MFINNKIFIIIFALAAIVTNNFCMQKTPTANYEKLTNLLKNAVITKDSIYSIRYSSLPPEIQYKMIKRFIQNNDLKALSLCLEYELNPNRYHKQLSPLHDAVQHCRPEAITILAKYNPDLIAVNDTWQTPLDSAVSLKCKKCINAMRHAISTKYNELVVHQKHCGLTKHILNPGPCGECPKNLRQQLKSHGLWKTATKDDRPRIIAKINQRVNQNAYLHAESGS